MTGIWDELFDRPVFVLTSDQDWAPSWAADDLLTIVRQHQLPLHVFRTNPCPSFDAAAQTDACTFGWHPNFLPGSSHGRDEQEVTSYMQKHFPGCRTARSHCFMEGTPYWKVLSQAGIVADSQVATVYQAGLEPLLHWSGIVRFPVYFEDDVFFEWEADSLNLDYVKQTLFTPGLKILNFHATFVACNMPSRPYYESIRSEIFGQAEAPKSICRERGTRTILTELIASILDTGHRFESFELLVDRVLAHIKSDPERFPRPFHSR